MSKNDIVLSDNIESVRIDTKLADIRITSGDVKEPSIRCSGSFDIIEKGSSTVVVEKEVDGRDKVTRLNLIGGGYIESSSNISITYIKGIPVVEKLSISKEPITKDFVELIIPKKSNNLEFALESLNGNVTIENLYLSKLIVRTLSGNVTLKDIDFLVASIKTETGDINAEILESLLNYKLFLKSIGPNIESNDSPIYPLPLEEKHELELESKSGEVNVLFKGKKFHRN